MSANSKIEWTDATWNPITGCTPVSAGCQNCYAKVMAERFPVTHAGRDVMYDGYSGGYEDCGAIPFSILKYHSERLEQPLHWRKPRRIFICSMGDLFHDDVKGEMLRNIFAVIQQCPKHTFIILTKRPENMRQWQKAVAECRSWPANEPVWPNVWFGVSVENQAIADERIPILLDIPAAVRFVSVEPILERVCLYHSMCIGVSDRQRKNQQSFVEATRLDWVVCGAETGAKKRPCDDDWINGVRKDCLEMGIPFFGKKDSNGNPILPREFPRVEQ